MQSDMWVAVADLTPVDEEILDVLQEGARTQSYIVDEIGRSRNHVHNRLQILAGSGYIENIHRKTALYELVEDPRETAEIEDEDEDEAAGGE